MADPGATQVALRFDSAYDRVGTGNAFTYTRALTYEFTFMRMNKQSIDQIVTMTAAELLGMSTTETFTSAPSAMPIEILLTRSDGVVLIPGDSYRVTISVIDGALRRSSQSYEGDFTMLRNGASDELAALNIDCSTGDNDGIASAYELSIGTDCNSGVDDYIGSDDPANAPIDATTITFALQDQPGQSTPIAVAGAASRRADCTRDCKTSRYPQIDTGVTCVGDCNNLKAFIVSSGLVEDDPNDDTDGADADAMAMVTDRCPPDHDSTSPNPIACWVDEVMVNEDGNMEIRLQLGYNVIDWVAADDNGNLILSTRQKQLVYVAPVVVLLGGITDLVLPAGSPDITASFRVQFTQFRRGTQSGNSMSFIGGGTRTIPDNVSPTISFSSSSCDSAISVSSPSAKGRYTYTATDAGTCSFDALTGTSPVPFADPSSLDPLFYFAGNGINVVRASTTNRLARESIAEIAVVNAGATTVNAVTSDGDYSYRVTTRVTTLPANEDVIVEITLRSPPLGEIVEVLLENGAPTGDFPSVPEPSEGRYISIEAAIGTSIEAATITHRVDYPILPSTALRADPNNDGVPDNNRVDDDILPNILIGDKLGPSAFTEIVVQSGYRVTLGNIARRNAHGQAQLGQMREDPLIPDGSDLPRNYGNEGVFEFDVYLPENTNTAFISIPLSTPLDTNKGYVKYRDGRWVNFATSDGDAHYSAPGIDIFGGGAFTCPSPVNPSSDKTLWRNSEDGELIKDHQCVLLVIKDNGPNDNDGELNGIIVDPGAPGDFPSDTTRGPRGGGGGATDLWFLLMLLGLIAVPVLTRHRKRLTR